MSALSNPYMGNAGMNMPAMDDKWMGHGTGREGGVIGVSWNALPTIRKVLGIK